MSGLKKDFLWGGGATAANQCEGGYLEGNRGLGTVDVIPAGVNRRLLWKEECIIIIYKRILISHHMKQ